MFGDLQKHFRFAVIARNKDSVGFVLYSILEPEIDRRGFIGPLEQDCLGLTHRRIENTYDDSVHFRQVPADLCPGRLLVRG